MPRAVLEDPDARPGRRGSRRDESPPHLSRDAGHLLELFTTSHAEFPRIRPFADSALNFTPRLDREFLLQGYRALMRRLHEPRVYYRRLRTFLASHRPGGPRLRRSARDLLAFVKSLWLLGVRQIGRTAYWIFLWSTLLRPSAVRSCPSSW